MPEKKPVGQAAPTTRRTLPSAGPEETGTQEQPMQQRVAPTGGVDRASLFDQAPKEEGFGVPAGQYVAVLIEATHEVDGQKESIKFSYEIAEGDCEGKKILSWYNLFDKEGQPGRGMGFFKRDCEVLNVEVPAYDDLDNGLRNIADERLLCTITVKQNGQYTNVYLQGLAAQ